MKLRDLACVSLALLPYPTLARTAPVRPGAPTALKPAPLVVREIGFRQFVLPNGLTLLVHEDHRQPVAAVSVWYHVGSQNETIGRTGFAHLYEHLMFNGSEHANDDWFKFTNALGATDLNGTTAEDRTNFFETVPTVSLDRTLWLESDRMGHLLGAVDQVKLDEQRGVVENEKRQRANSPFGAVPETISAAVYPPGHPYSWQAIGSIEDLDAASLDDVKTWFRTWYGAGNAVVVISGDVDPDAMREKVAKYFGAVPRGPALKRNEEWIAKRTGERRAVLQVPAPQARVYMVWNTPAFRAADSDLLGIAADALGGGTNSRLHQRLVVGDKSAISVAAFDNANELGGTFTITATVRHGTEPAAIERVIREELARLLRDGPTEAELERYKQNTHANAERHAEQPFAQGIALAEGFLYAGNAAHYRASLARQYGATAAQVRDAARAWLSDGVYVLTALPLTDATVIADVDRTTMPPIGRPAGLALVPPTRFTLSNGLNVDLVERHSSPTLAMEMIFRSGTDADRTKVLPDLGSTALAMTRKGTATRSEQQIDDQIERLATGIGWSNSNERMRYRLTALTANLAPSLDLYADVLLHPSFPADAYKRMQTEAIAGIDQAKATPNGKIGRTMPALLFGRDHPYAATATAATIDATTPAMLRAWYDRWVRPDNVTTLLVVGDVSPAQLRPLLEARLGVWRAPTTPLPVAAPFPAVERHAAPRLFLIDQPGAAQSTISIAGPSVLHDDADREAVAIVNNTLGGGFLSRLNMNLREDKHWSYGAHSGINAAEQVGTFSVGTSVQTDKTADALREIDRELHDLTGKRPLTAVEIRQAKDADVLTTAAPLGTAQGVASLYSEMIRYGLPVAYWNGYVDRVEAFTPARLAAAAARLDHPDQLTWIVVGDLAKIEADVRKLGIATVTVIDADGKVVRQG